MIFLLGLIGLGAGTCYLCKFFGARDIARDESGVPHDEHDPATGAVLTGWKLWAMQALEVVFNPICKRVNKWLGRVS